MKIKVPNPSGEGEIEIDLSTVDAYKEHLNSVRQDAATKEKNKLYSQQSELRNKVAALEAQNKDLSTKLETAVTTVNNQDPTVQQPPATTGNENQMNQPKTPTAEGALTTDQVAKMIADAMNGALPSKLNEVLKPLQDNLQNLQKETFTQFKERRIKELGDTYKPYVEAGIIRGESKEEIENSIQSVAKLLESQKPQDTTPQVPPSGNPQVVTQPQTTATPPPPAPPGVPPQNPNMDALNNLKGLSQEEYAKKRAEILAKAKQAYPQG